MVPFGEDGTNLGYSRARLFRRFAKIPRKQQVAALSLISNVMSPIVIEERRQNSAGLRSGGMRQHFGRGNAFTLFKSHRSSLFLSWHLPRTMVWLMEAKPLIT
jgi:hypothetical protein